VLAIEETGFLKQGRSSCGVSLQYTGSAGKITNCQIGVFAAYVSPPAMPWSAARCCAAIKVRTSSRSSRYSALYLPKTWTDGPVRIVAVHAPDDTTLAIKPALAVGMTERAILAGVSFASVAADSVYGIGHVEMVLRRASKGYVLGVNSDEVV